MNGYFKIKKFILRVLKVVFIRGGKGCDPVPVYIVTDKGVTHVTRSVRIAGDVLCPECDSEILSSGYCMMGHYHEQK